MSATVTEKPTAEEVFNKVVAKQRARFNTYVSWHLLLHADVGIDLPYNGDANYINVNVGEYARNPETGRRDYTNYIVDEEATIAVLAKIVQYARKRGFKVKKEYGNNFQILIELADDTSPSGAVTMIYCAERDAVCTKRVVGTKLIPATTTPERVEEEIEWECNKLSFLSIPNGE